MSAAEMRHVSAAPTFEYFTGPKVNRVANISKLAKIRHRCNFFT